MSLVDVRCTNCGAIFQEDDSKEAAVCPICKNPYVVEKAIHFFKADVKAFKPVQQEIQYEEYEKLYKKNVSDDLPILGTISLMFAVIAFLTFFIIKIYSLGIIFSIGSMIVALLSFIFPKKKGLGIAALIISSPIFFLYLMMYFSGMVPSFSDFFLR